MILVAALMSVGALVGALVWGIADGLRSGMSSEPIPTGMANFGNPYGHMDVPPAGRAIDSNHPNHVIGNGTPTDCTSEAVIHAVAAGGIIRFNCGKKPVTIVMTETATIGKTEHLVVLDGGGLVTLSGNGKRRILFSDTCAGKWSTDDCVNQPYPQIVVQNMIFQNGFDGARQGLCNTSAPQCWYGGVNGGGAIYAEGGQFKAINSRFVNNHCYSFGPDLGGGAIRVLAQYQNRPVYVTNDIFIGGRCSNGGALSSIDVQWDILNSVFRNNAAIGWGANPAAPGTPGGGSGGAIYNDGENYATLVAGTIMYDNSAREGGGAIFYVVNSGWGNLVISNSRLSQNHSGMFESYVGIFDSIDKRDLAPRIIGSTDN